MATANYEDLDPIIIAAIRHRGPHDPRHTDAAWEELIVWASPRRLLGRRFDVRGVGLLWDDPRIFPPDQRRYDVGIPIDPEDAPDVERPAFVTVTSPGEYLKATHKGPYDTISRTYDDVLGNTLRYERMEMVAAPMIELYRNSPAEVAEEDLTTDIYIPVIQL